MPDTKFDRDIKLAQKSIKALINETGPLFKEFNRELSEEEKELLKKFGDYKSIILDRIKRYDENRYSIGNEILKKEGEEDRFSVDCKILLRGLYGELNKAEIENRYCIFTLMTRLRERKEYKEIIVFCRRADPFYGDGKLECVSEGVSDWFERSSDSLERIVEYIWESHVKFLVHNKCPPIKARFICEPHKDSYLVRHGKGRAIPLSKEDQGRFMQIYGLL